MIENRQLTTESILVERNQVWIAPTIAADGHGQGSETGIILWGIMSELGWDCQIFPTGKMHKRGPYQEDNWLQDNVIYKTFVSIKRFWGKSEKRDFWTIVSYLRVVHF